MIDRQGAPQCGAPTGWRSVSAAACAVALAALAACGTAPLPSEPAPPPAASAKVGTAPAAVGDVLASSSRFVIYLPRPDDTLKAIAARFLGGEEYAWMIGDYNNVTRPQTGQALVVPLEPTNRSGVYADQYQTIPILCYHRFGPAGSAHSNKMVVSASNFAAQLEWLAKNDYHVLRMSQLTEYLNGKRMLPKRSVVITIDDGYESVHRFALPLLRKYGFPATLFMYSDFIGAGDALSWPQLQDLQSSGLVDIQAHSKTHHNLIERQAGESDEKYKQTLDAEARVPREVLEKRLPIQVRQYAYPFGDANDMVLDALTRQRYQLAVTVTPGGNAFFAQPLMLRRTMIFGDHDIDNFKAKLQISRGFTAP